MAFAWILGLLLSSPAYAQDPCAQEAATAFGAEAAVDPRHFGFEELVGARTPTTTGAPLLQAFARKLNGMITDGVPAEIASAYAAREIQLMSAFAEGNSEASKQIARAVYRKITGKSITLPPAFSEIGAQSLQDLTQSLAKHLRYQRGSNLLLDIFLDKGLLPKRVAVGPANPKVTDRPFTDFAYDTRTFRFKDLDPEVVGTAPGQTLFYGRPAPNRQKSEELAKLLFQHGRVTRGTPHMDLARHVISTGGEPSGFFPTSKTAFKAKNFIAREFPTGILFMVDGQGADVLDVDKFTKAYDLFNEYAGEGEVIFNGSLSPRRIKGAVIYENGEPIEVLANPNYEVSR